MCWESPVGQAAWGAQVIPLPGRYIKGWITLANGVTVEARLVTFSERASGYGPLRGSETGRQVSRRKTCVVTVRPWCQDPGMEDRGSQLWMAVCRKPPSQAFSSLCSDTSVPPTSQPYLGSKKREGFWKVRKWGWGLVWREQEIGVKITPQISQYSPTRRMTGLSCFLGYPCCVFLLNVHYTYTYRLKKNLKRNVCVPLKCPLYIYLPLEEEY